MTLNERNDCSVTSYSVAVDVVNGVVAYVCNGLAFFVVDLRLEVSYFDELGTARCPVLTAKVRCQCLTLQQVNDFVALEEVNGRLVEVDVEDKARHVYFLICICLC